MQAVFIVVIAFSHWVELGQSKFAGLLSVQAGPGLAELGVLGERKKATGLVSNARLKWTRQPSPGPAML